MSMVSPSRSAPSGWEPPDRVSKPELVAMSERFLAEPDLEIRRTEDVFRVEAAGLEWDIGSIVYEPADPAKIPVGPDGRKIGFFLMHGGAGDFRVHEQLGRLLASKRGIRVVNMTYPGRFYFDDPDHNWPGDTIHPDGSVRTPIWQRGEHITPDQYEVVKDPSLRKTYGTLTLARARPGTRFYDRMAAWPLAFETAMLDLCRRRFPPAEFSIYAHGHSTGGPFSHMLLQRVPNVVGIAGIENSPFGYIWQMVNGNVWPGPFNDLVVRTWRDLARYRGAEALKQQGPDVLMSLPALIEDIFAAWEQVKHLPQIKAEYIVHINVVPALTAAAEATAARLKLNEAATRELVQRYRNYPLPLTGPGVKPVPPLLYIIAANSRDHSKDNYFGKIVPALAKIDPAPKVRVVQFGTGAHGYQKAEEGLPMGLSPAAITLWYEAIMAGYYQV
jgi:hypothetical protein